MTPTTPASQPALRRELKLWHVVSFNISALLGVRWLAAAAHAGPGSLLLWLMAALAFLLPCALVISALSKKFPEEGGLYIWTKQRLWRLAWLSVRVALLRQQHYLLSDAAALGRSDGELHAGSSRHPIFRRRALRDPGNASQRLWLTFILNLVGLRDRKMGRCSWRGLQLFDRSAADSCSD